MLARLFGRGGNRVGALLHDGASARIVPPGTGRAHALRIGYELDRAPARPATTTTDFAAMLDATATLARRRSLIIVVSDFIGTGEWDRQLLRLVHRHDVVALRVMDADRRRAARRRPDRRRGRRDRRAADRRLERPAVPGAATAPGVDERDAVLDQRMRRANVPLHRIDTDRDLVEALVEVVASDPLAARHEHRLAGLAGARGAGRRRR